MVVTFGHSETRGQKPETNKISQLLRSLQTSQQPLFKTLPSKIGNPFSLYKTLHNKFQTSFILESATGPKEFAKYTFLGVEPAAILKLKSGQLYVDGDPIRTETDPFSFLKKLTTTFETSDDSSDFKFLGGLVGYISYDFIRYLEQLPTPFSSSVFPDLEFGLYLDGIIHNSEENNLVYFTYGKDRSSRLCSVVESAGPEEEEFNLKDYRTIMSKKDFLQKVEKAKKYIRSGDIYQVVLSKQRRGRFTGDPFYAYQRLRDINPSPYMYHLQFGKRRIIGSSPEMLASVTGREVRTFPIAGTRPLGDTPQEQKKFRKELLEDEKELAEHNMLVDLARNDVGRVAQFGSVHLPQYVNVKKFSHVQHIVSEVKGRLKDNQTMTDALAAIFPAGTVSGAPKLRAMQIIDELEDRPRGPYAGAVGYFSLNETMDSCITIRSLFTSGDEIRLQAGAGIVADSVGEKEWLETDHKLKALQQAIGGNGDTNDQD